MPKGFAFMQSIDPALRWDDVQVFLSVARQGTLSGAGAALAVNPSTVHRRLAAFEAALGTRLFDRSPSGLTLTAAGEAALPLAEQIELDVAGLLRALVGRDSAPSGVVHLTAPETLVPLLIEPLAALRSRFEAIDLRVSFADRYFDLARLEADVAVRPSPDPPADAVGRRIARVAWAVYARRTALSARPAGAEIDALPWVEYTQALQHLAAARWRRAHHSADPVLLAVNSVAAMQQVISAADCRGFLPCFMGDVDPRLRRLDPLLPQASALWLLTHRDLRRTARVRAVVDHLWAALRAQRGLFEGEAEGEG